ncbi:MULTISPECIES: hypothetical protein [Brevibacillus]|uniref:Uncharacterized protein n=1 Tax=Brevibacillus borstelensis AK1 TaxID=1300222 RepID=M8DK31_9BACL|nr:hypothetical protein [Brevibacillus borstelensis]EMT53963.1 hypothetical protein I532_00115 [Brevibacillus borstelensis AK1]KKX56376.1 hypothetical protein X546_04705 [Brevibacillus borstelensis cifa_chp40]MBE5394992.1 hypothetical protein [Brevibacillus borstelensis]MCC0563782.1 hypothetical protein [Brevibacillus borstelensis]MCM3473400.1 hypothetical protein [Brevibacillus borstelensis]
MSKPKKGRGKKDSKQHPNQVNLKIVTSGTCMVCKEPCTRGMEYVEKMAQPGAVGFGVPCILTRPRA